MVAWLVSHILDTGIHCVRQFIDGCESLACCLLGPPRGTWFHVELLFGLGPNIIGTPSQVTRCLRSSLRKRHINDVVGPLLDVVFDRVLFGMVVCTVVFSSAPDEVELALGKSTF